MPRSPRIEYEGAQYHVMCRGDRREAIFLDDRDRLVFLETLEETCGRTGWKVLSYVLMGNHYHLLLETPEANLVRGMQWFQGTYTARFNARHQMRGHLFQGRYKAVPVEGEDPDYGRIVSDYIHLNPARAGLLGLDGDGKPGQLAGYFWSSFPRFCAGKEQVGWLDGARVLWWHNWKMTQSRDRLAYRRFMERRAVEAIGSESDQTEWKELRRGWFLGGDEFRGKLEEKIADAVKGKRRDSYGGPPLAAHDQGEASRLVKEGLKSMGLTRTEMRGLAQNDVRKQGLAWLVKTHTVVGHNWMQGEVGFGHRSNISRAVSRFRMAKDPEVRRIKKILMHICAD